MAWTTGDTTGAISFSRLAEERGAVGGGEPEAPLSVTQAVGCAKARVDAMPTLVVTGEVTGFRGPSSGKGHCYFMVKDDASAMNVIVWAGVYAASGITLRDGMQLQMVGRFEVYSARGSLSFVARRIFMSGEGQLRQQVAELARRLEAEGLMAESRKRRIPRFCTRVAVVTSLSGSVIDDVRRTLRRRNPLVELQVAGCKVQGTDAPPTIERALAAAAAARPDCILLVRGGGSFEDLMTFNDESVARAVAACPVPVVTGIGHEPDTCICDMVADRRTSTPTAAAESVAPAIDEIAAAIADRRVRLARAMASRVERESQSLERQGALARRSIESRLQAERVRVESLARHRCLVDPSSIVDDRVASLMQSEQRLVDAIPRSLARRERSLAELADRMRSSAGRIARPHEATVGRLAATLDALSPLKVLGRGYAIARTGEGHVVSDASDLTPGDAVCVLVGAGSFDAQVIGVHPATRQGGID
ncbi:exodeoxyribonuclease VII large subunit [uncultured Parolsenella sp.]|uniref:exodeoxyribonuclease VII large subunit n=1 Tax=uncultured Parolsenella sp. TaxID=2083008 RepID=UPI0027D96E3B|nr:exodeoxyribonuclease VII large subunit [uncultured Parolsenella sp.]